MEIIRRKPFLPDAIGFAEQDFFLETRFYKYNKNSIYAMVLLILCVAIFILGITLLNTIHIVAILLALLFVVPVFAALSGKTWFSFSALDPRVLRLERNLLQVGEEVFLLRQIENISVYIHSFYGFRFGQGYRPGPGAWSSEFGDKNRIVFVVSGREYSFRFILRSGKAYVILYELMAHWKSLGVQILIQEEYPYHFVIKMIADKSSQVP